MRLVRRRVEKLSFFEFFFTNTSLQIFLECLRVKDLYILTLFGPLYQTRGGVPCEPLCAKSQNRSKMAHARQI